MLTINLHGSLKEYGGTFKIDAKTAREAESIIIAHLRRQAPSNFHGKVYLSIVGFDDVNAYDKLLKDGDVLDVMPALVLGGPFVFLIPILIKVVVYTAISLAISGVLSLLAPAPTLDTSPEDTNPEASKYISGTANTTKIGTRIPLAYGTFPIWGQFLSVNINTRDISTGPYSSTSSTNYNSNYTAGYTSGTSINVY